MGGERSLITVITGKHLKLGMLPADAGCVVDNVATIYAIYRAVKFNEPLMGFTVSGDAVQNQQLYCQDRHQPSGAGGCLRRLQAGWAKKVLSGGPMMVSP